jgi:hypothetical protein
MSILKLTFLLAAAHLLLVVITFMLFGLGLEGHRNLGHEFLWLLLQPGASLPGPWILILLMNSAFWGFCGAVLFKVGLRVLNRA